MLKIKKVYTACQLALGVSISIFTTLPAFAQDDSVIETEKENKVIVTGSRIKRTDTESASPLIVIDSSDIIGKGFRSVEDVLSGVAQNSGGTVDQTDGVQGFAPSTASINFRGVGTGRTLFLLDGKRMPVFPIATGSDNFFNLSAIPVSAVDRIEIVTDGGSAVYGSDAMAGVINIILKKDIEGSGLSALLTYNEGGGNNRERLQYFTGDSSENTSWSLIAELDHKDAILGSDRESIFARSPYAAASQTHTANGPDGPIISPECADFNGFIIQNSGRCYVDITYSWGLSPETNKQSVLLNFNHKFGPDLTFSSRLLYSNHETEFLVAPLFFGGGVFINQLKNPIFDVTDPQIMPGHASYIGSGSGAQTIIFRTFTDLVHPGMADGTGGLKGGDDDETSAMFALEGKLGDSYDWSASATYSEQKTATTGWGILHSPIAHRLITDPTFNLWAPQDAQFFSDNVAQWRMDGKSSTTFVDASLSGDLLKMPAGTLSFALAVDYEHNDISNIPNDVLATLETGFGSTGVDGSRNRFGLGAETLIPVLESLTASVAIRYDGYDDATDINGRATSMIKLEWRPVDDLLFRATWGETFRAPDLQAIYAKNSSAFAFGLTDTHGTEDISDDEVISDAIPVVLAGGLGLEEETGTTSNVGIVYSPFENFNLTLDYYEIDIKDRVSPINPQTILNNLDESRVERADDGTLLQIYGGNENISMNNTSGVDFSSDYKMNFESWGELRIALNWSHVLNNESQIDENSPIVDNLATNAAYSTDRGSLSFNWTYQKFTTSLYINHIGDVPTFFLAGERTDAWTTANLSTNYELNSDLTLRISINNLTDEAPPIDSSMSQTRFGAPYNQFVHNIIGREWAVSVDYNF